MWFSNTTSKRWWTVYCWSWRHHYWLPDNVMQQLRNEVNTLVFSDSFALYLYVKTLSIVLNWKSPFEPRWGNKYQFPRTDQVYMDMFCCKFPHLTFIRKKKKTASDFTSASIRFVKNGTGFPDWNVANYINGLGYLLDLPLKSCLVSHSISRESFAVHDLLKLLRSCLRKVPS